MSMIKASQSGVLRILLRSAEPSLLRLFIFLSVGISLGLWEHYFLDGWLSTCLSLAVLTFSLMSMFESALFGRHFAESQGALKSIVAVAMAFLACCLFAQVTDYLLWPRNRTALWGLALWCGWMIGVHSFFFRSTKVTEEEH
jgi:hypothetical protein